MKQGHREEQHLNLHNEEFSYITSFHTMYKVELRHYIISSSRPRAGRPQTTTTGTREKRQAKRTTRPEACHQRGEALKRPRETPEDPPPAAWVPNRPGAPRQPCPSRAEKRPTSGEERSPQQAKKESKAGRAAHRQQALNQQNGPCPLSQIETPGHQVRETA